MRRSYVSKYKDLLKENNGVPPSSIPEDVERIEDRLDENVVAEWRCISTTNYFFFI